MCSAVHGTPGWLVIPVGGPVARTCINPTAELAGEPGINHAQRFHPADDLWTVLKAQGCSFDTLAELDLGHDDVLYNEPGRMVGLGGSNAPASPCLPPRRYHRAATTSTCRKRQVVQAYRDGGWRLPELMAKIPTASEFYCTRSAASLQPWASSTGRWSSEDERQTCHRRATLRHLRPGERTI